MTGLVRRNFGSADETRRFPEESGRLDLLETERGQVGRAVFAPGWQWSTHIKPLAGTDSCQEAHTGYVVSGRMRIVMDDGEAADAEPGDLLLIAPGHDAWVLGDDPCVVLDWTGYGNFARPPGD
ncbi:cupin domain-containing protein [Streptomyces sp. NPDC097619]|uniref:cupin domain-containing protein n=1 Tax=Streptomyces sp. NPDC097619 TaxID=3157228 RepID=UPI003331F99B